MRTDLGGNKVSHGVARRCNIGCPLAIVCHEYVHWAVADISALSACTERRTYGSSLYIGCPSSVFSCTKRSSRETMIFTSRESKAFSSGRITWLLTWVSRVTPVCRWGRVQVGQATHGTNGRRDNSIEKRRKLEAQHGIADKATEVARPACIARTRRPRERPINLFIRTRLDMPLLRR